MDTNKLLELQAEMSAYRLLIKLGHDSFLHVVDEKTTKVVLSTPHIGEIVAFLAGVQFNVSR